MNVVEEAAPANDSAADGDDDRRTSVAAVAAHVGRAVRAVVQMQTVADATRAQLTSAVEAKPLTGVNELGRARVVRAADAGKRCALVMAPLAVDQSGNFDGCDSVYILKPTIRRQRCCCRHTCSSRDRTHYVHRNERYTRPVRAT